MAREAGEPGGVDEPPQGGPRPDAESFRRFRVIPTESGMTLGVLVARRLPGVSRKRAHQIIKSGGVYVNKLRIRLASVPVAAGERITVYPGAPDVPRVDPDTLVFAHRDPNFVVIDKPPGVAVAQTRHSARGTLAEALRRRLESEGVRRPYVGVVHRIDQPASGLVLYTIRDVANRSVHKQFVDHAMDRRYRALVRGTTQPQFVVDAALRTSGRSVRVAAPGDRGAQSARTEFQTLGPGAHPRVTTSLVEARLNTGRTHQIRVHAAHAGHPLVGDARYGDAGEPGAGDEILHLHAYRLEFVHPLTNEAVVVEAALPAWAIPRAIPGAG